MTDTTSLIKRKHRNCLTSIYTIQMHNLFVYALIHARHSLINFLYSKYWNSCNDTDKLLKEPYNQS